MVRPPPLHYAGRMHTNPPDWIIEPTEQSFEADVVERSATVPVVIDFWAPWCGPCRQLAPVLEKLAAEYAGRFLLAKINTDLHPSLAAAFQVQSLPTVVAVRDRQLVDAFQGALPERDVRTWLDQILPSAADQLVRQGDAVAASQPDAAEALYREALTHDPQHAAARIGLARLCVEGNRLDEAERILQELEARGYLEPEAERVRSLWHVRRTADAAGGAARLRAEAAARPDDLTLQVQLAEALAAEGDVRSALETCLAVVARDRAGVGQQAKGAMLEILRTVDDADLASDFRRRLATLLY